MAVNRVDYNGNTLIDLTNDTVNAENLMTGYTAHDKSGAQIHGTFNPFKPQIIVMTENGNYLTCAKSGETTLYGTATDGAYVFEVPSYGTWAITATVPEMFLSESASVNVTAVKQYVLELSALPAFGDASWETIQTLVKSGDAANIWQIGDTKNFQDTNGISRTVEIVNIDENSMILDLTVPYYRGSIYTHTGISSGYNEWSSTTFYNSLPTDFKNIVSSCFYFSQDEIFGSSPLALFSTQSGRAKGVNWWTSTISSQRPPPSYGYNFYYVTENGTSDTEIWTASYYLNPKITIK